ncbi:MAG: DUF3347 domain-containing protein [Deltaproteobacteria bacterium]|jgi:Cu(I)/Ag(I) efflux system membrane fusion protein|nr:DUF3347 domain-containing protein [Deltaproteobacteria bacterium]
MINRRSAPVLVCILAAATGSLCACSKGKDRAASQSSLPAATRASVEEAVSAYEAVREALADDRSDVTAKSEALADAARRGAAGAPEPLRDPLEDLSSAADRLARVERGDLDAAREAFGELSRALIALLSEDPSLQEGRYVYECPMVDGYKKWVQVSEGTSNPYMGRKMLECGTEAGF